MGFWVFAMLSKKLNESQNELPWVSAQSGLVSVAFLDVKIDVTGQHMIVFRIIVLTNGKM